MKKFLFLAIIGFTFSIIIGCTNSFNDTSSTNASSSTTTENIITDGNSTDTTTTNKNTDSVAPEIHIFDNNKNVTVFLNQDYNLLEGVYAKDNIDGVITSNIVIDTNGYSNKIIGTYKVKYNVKDAAGNDATEKIKTINVIKNYEVYTGIIQNEIEKPTMPKCFAGAWYHKVVSSKDTWIGMEGTVTLPTYDINRYKNLKTSEIITDPSSDVLITTSYKNQDNPSIYMGGNAGSESDVGLSLSLVQLKTGTITTSSVAFRPFWRYITTTDYDLGGYDIYNGRFYSVGSASTGSRKNCQANYHFSFTEYYYLPGDKITMRIVSPEVNKLQLQIDLIEKSTLPFSVTLREQQNWKDPESFRSPIFSSPGHNSPYIKAEFKRVNAIDQSGNEGKPAINTTTNVLNAEWESSYLFRKINNEIKKVPMTNERVNIMNCPDSNAFTRTQTNIQSQNGGELISIKPGIIIQKEVLYFNKKENYDIV